MTCIFVSVAEGPPHEVSRAANRVAQSVNRFIYQGIRYVNKSKGTKGGYSYQVVLEVTCLHDFLIGFLAKLVFHVFPKEAELAM
jgi:hypothetical protein